MILLSDPRVPAVAVADCGEPLVDLRDVPRLRMAEPTGDGVGALVREGVAERLVAAQDALPAGLRLLVVEGYRSPQRQRTIFDGYREELRRLHPEWTDEWLFVETCKFVSPVDVAPHCTGGAVDLTLGTDDGVELDLGTPVDATPEASGNACFTDAPGIPPQAREYRRILSRAMTGAGFVNYPTEWWHWSYGDRYWALMTGADAACYGPVRFPVGTAVPASRTGTGPGTGFDGAAGVDGAAGGGAAGPGRAAVPDRPAGRSGVASA
ncbi:MAG: M15 family metallopeptidase [Micromonosporaceae bacterium]